MTKQQQRKFGDITLRGYQQGLRENVYGGWPSRVGQLIVAPTGSGKTAVAVACASDWLNDHESGKVIWIAHRRELLKQASVMADRMKVDKSKFSFVSLFHKDWSEFVDGNPILIVADESHHASCSTMVHAKNSLQPTNLLGMSATPVRADHHALGFNRSIIESGYDALIHDGYLAQYEHYTIPEWSTEVVAENFVKFRERWGKTVLFFLTEAECREFMSMLPPSILAKTGLVTGDSDRDYLIPAFSRGELDTLVNMNVLTEGYDEDSLETVFVRKTQSQTVVTQAAGRVMRPYNGTIKKVVQSPCSKSFINIATPCRSFSLIDGSWRKSSVDPKAVINSLYDVSKLFVNLKSNKDVRKMLGCFDD